MAANLSRGAGRTPGRLTCNRGSKCKPLTRALTQLTELTAVTDARWAPPEVVVRAAPSVYAPRMRDLYPDPMTQVWQVQVAAPSKEAATELAKSAVESHLAASGQILGPVTSVFWHLGEFGTGEEWAVVLKTTEGRYKELERHLVERHEWTTPEITAVPLAAGLPAYLDWVERTTRQ